jgi:TolB-like protein/DNA-binding winged helix-turn-helix (wHTH) protein
MHGEVTGSEVANGWIVFDQVEIDLAGRRLFVAGAETPLEPKAFGVLALLARHPGQAFTREEILDAVWGHTHVTPGVLNRVITLLRQALGESADNTLYLHTLHGVGYRFDAVTRWAESRRNTALEPNVEAPAAPADTTRVDLQTSLPIAAMSAVRGDAELADADAFAIAADVPAVTTPRRRGWHALGWIGVAALFALAAVIYQSNRRSADAPPVARPTAVVQPTLVVLPLRAVDSGQDENVLADGLSEELITRLARVDGLRLISQTSAALARSENLDLNQLAARLHVSHALEGSLRQSGQQLRIDLRLIEIPGGRTLWAQDYDRGLADVFAIQSEVAQSVAGALTLKLGLSNDTGDRDPQLFRDYLQLRHRLVEYPEPDDYAKLIVDARAFAARVPDYARAQGLLARVNVREMRALGSMTDAESAEAARAAARALELDPDQIEAHAASAALACRATEWRRCMDEFRRVLELAPADSILRAAYGFWLADVGYLEQGLAQTEIGVASDPLNYEASLARARVLDTMGRHAEAGAAFEATARLPAGTRTRLSYARWYNAMWRSDYVAARDFAGDMPADQHFRETYLAVTDALQDPARWPQVESSIRASERVTGRYNFLRLMQPAPDYAKILGALEVALRDRTSSYHLLIWNPEFLPLRRDPAFQDFLRRTHMIDYWRSNAWPPQCKPDGDGARCD